MKICPIAYVKICQNAFQTLSITKITLQNYQRLWFFCQSGTILLNLVTLNFTVTGSSSSRRDDFKRKWLFCDWICCFSHASVVVVVVVIVVSETVSVFFRFVCKSEQLVKLKRVQVKEASAVTACGCPPPACCFSRRRRRWNQKNIFVVWKKFFFFRKFRSPAVFQKSVAKKLNFEVALRFLACLVSSRRLFKKVIWSPFIFQRKLFQFVAKFKNDDPTKSFEDTFD